MNNISTLSTTDLIEAYNIEQASHIFPWLKTVFLTNQGERFLNLKLSVNRQMAGFAITQIILNEASLLNIAIHPQWQRCGFGYHLLDQLLKKLTNRGVITVWLEVRASNTRAIALYNKCGFNQVTLRRNYYPSITKREDAIIMAIQLD
ncbi:ribosomal protein S18-alanine N-acetyltransferase [Candidatus Gillettellia adelgis]